MTRLNKFVVCSLAVIGLVVPYNAVYATDDLDAIRAECVKNTARCDMNYGGKELTFQAKFHSSDAPIAPGMPRVALFYTGNERRYSNIHIECFNVPLDLAAKYDVGDTVTVSGTYGGFGELSERIILENCKF